MNEEKHMEWDEWCDTYQPLMLDATMDDGDIMEFDTHQEVLNFFLDGLKHIAEDDIANHVWTETAGDGWTYVSTGFHVVDRMHYYICLKPWKELNEACMYSDVGTWCDYCDDYVHSCEHDDEDWQDKADLLAEEQANE